jgi:hypothetical protein
MLGMGRLFTTRASALPCRSRRSIGLGKQPSNARDKYLWFTKANANDHSWGAVEYEFPASQCGAARH